VGIVAVQGSVHEHVQITKKALEETAGGGDVVKVTRPEHLRDLDALILPGGESTTISKLLLKYGLFEEIKKMGKSGVPIMGTCAGCILLASRGDDEVTRTRTELLGLMDMAVDRNAFGRQRESFEAEVRVEDIGSFHGVFIRAPVITETWGRCKPVGWLGDAVVMAKQDNLLALAFHPELTGDTRIHRMLIEMAHR